MNVKTTAERLTTLEAGAFRTGEDLAEIKAGIAELREDAAYTRKDVDLLLTHYGIERPGTGSGSIFCGGSQG
ncbi:hypothetical protein ITP53_04845 [Nonomuraea sp. K274]|uniref:Uncharacterized protein n=1 Tax=Nonomuraea cypriaca TaxID=1187855 RepID=A0A931EYC8_9ACTN|nr:hypothetical protein [Nonomuraea cypriaca]MBF8185076.1 hypothetical protein [Nonomuraea cypriaca]